MAVLMSKKSTTGRSSNALFSVFSRFSLSSFLKTKGGSNDAVEHFVDTERATYARILDQELGRHPDDLNQPARSSGS